MLNFPGYWQIWNWAITIGQKFQPVIYYLSLPWFSDFIPGRSRFRLCSKRDLLWAMSPTEWRQPSDLETAPSWLDCNITWLLRMSPVCSVILWPYVSWILTSCAHFGKSSISHFNVHSKVFSPLTSIFFKKVLVLGSIFVFVSVTGFQTICIAKHSLLIRLLLTGNCPKERPGGLGSI